MRRSRFYIAMCILAFVVSLIGLIWANSNITFNDILAWNITIDFVIIKQIATYIFSAMIGCGIFALIYAIGFGKNNTELVNAVNKALAELTADGTVQKIIDKYIKAN